MRSSGRPTSSKAPGHIVKGDVSGGVEGIVASSMDIATHSADKVKEIITGRPDEDAIEP